MKDIFKKTSFWQRFKDSVALLAPGSEFVLLANDAGHHWIYATLGASIFGYLLGIWMVDHDKNGVIDLFEGK